MVINLLTKKLKWKDKLLCVSKVTYKCFYKSCFYVLLACPKRTKSARQQRMLSLSHNPSLQIGGTTDPSSLPSLHSPCCGNELNGLSLYTIPTSFRQFRLKAGLLPFKRAKGKRSNQPGRVYSVNDILAFGAVTQKR